MTEENPWAEHERSVANLKDERRKFAQGLEKLSVVPVDERDADWTEDYDNLSTIVRDFDNLIRSAELGRTQAESFAAAMAPATITAEAGQPLPEPEE